MLSLLWFLSPDARDGTLLVAYEGPKGRLVPGELVPEQPAEGPPTLRFPETFEFQLA